MRKAVVPGDLLRAKPLAKHCPTLFHLPLRQPGAARVVPVVGADEPGRLAQCLIGLRLPGESGFLTQCSLLLMGKLLKKGIGKMTF